MCIEKIRKKGAKVILVIEHWFSNGNVIQNVCANVCHVLSLSKCDQVHLLIIGIVICNFVWKLKC